MSVYGRFGVGDCCGCDIVDDDTGTSHLGPPCSGIALPTTLYVYFYDSWLSGDPDSAIFYEQGFTARYNGSYYWLDPFDQTGTGTQAPFQGPQTFLFNVNPPCVEGLTAVIGGGFSPFWDNEESYTRRDDPYFASFLADGGYTGIGPTYQTSQPPFILTIREEAPGEGLPVPDMFDCTGVTLPETLTLTLTLVTGSVDPACSSIEGSHTLTFRNDAWYKEFTCGSYTVRLSFGWGKGLGGVGPTINTVLAVGIFGRYQPPPLFGEAQPEAISGGLSSGEVDTCEPFEAFGGGTTHPMSFPWVIDLGFGTTAAYSWVVTE